MTERELPHEEHSPTPWQVGKGYGPPAPVIYGPVVGATPETLAIVADCHGITVRKSRETMANARRIAACVNACEGIPTDELQGMAVSELLKAWQDYTKAREATSL